MTPERVDWVIQRMAELLDAHDHLSLLQARFFAEAEHFFLYGTGDPHAPAATGLLTTMKKPKPKPRPKPY